MHVIHGFTLEEIFDQAYLAQLGCTFEQFSRAPMATLKRVGQDDAIDIMLAGFRPLLPTQVAFRSVLQAKWQQDGNPAEPHRRRRNLTHRSDVSMVCSVRIALAA
jgi:hypothetical protein